MNTMTVPRAPEVGDSIGKWEEWIEAYLQHLPNTDIDYVDYQDCLLVDKNFNTYKEKEIRNFGTNWDTALKWGDDKKFMPIMENNWKYMTYLHLKGVKPRTFDLQAYL